MCNSGGIVDTFPFFKRTRFWNGQTDIEGSYSCYTEGRIKKNKIK
jgi:hypothetical protein